MQLTRYQQIEQARTATPRTLMLVGENSTASWVWRVSWPCKALSDRGYIADWCLATNGQSALGAIEAGRYNVILTPRAHWSEQEAADSWIDAIHGYGLAWVYEIDDDGWSADIVKRQARLFETEWAKGEEQLERERQERIALINRADGVIVSSPGLANVARSFTSTPVWTVPNMIDVRWFEGRISNAKRVVDPDQLTIGWSGGLRDQGDLELVAAAWTKVAARYPQVKFIVHGVMAPVLTRSVPNDQLIMLAWSDFPDYPRSLMNFDVMCCSVQSDVAFNISKTPIKWYEASLAGAACVVSETLYGDEVLHERTGLIASTVEHWDEYLSRLVESREYREYLRNGAKAEVTANHSLDTQWPMWIEGLAGTLESSKTRENGLVYA